MNPFKVAAVGLCLLAAGCRTDVSAPGTAGIDLSDPLRRAQGALAVSASATGSAHLTVFPPPVPPGLGLRNFAFTAVKRADGSVTGEWQIVAGGSILHGPIDCLTIAPDARSARISGLVTEARFTLFIPGTAFAIELFDNGAGGSSDPDVSTQVRAFRNAAPEVGRAFCESGTVPPGADLQPLPSEHGNVTIRLLV